VHRRELHRKCGANGSLDYAVANDIRRQMGTGVRGGHHRARALESKPRQSWARLSHCVRYAALGFAALAACSDGAPPVKATPDVGASGTMAVAGVATAVASDATAAAPDSGADALPGLCSREGRADAVRDALCSVSPGSIQSLKDLQHLLRMEPPARGVAGSLEPVDMSHSASQFALLGLSTSLSGQLISPINPRLILLGQETALAFQRGAQQVEMAGLARDRSTYNFYLLTFTRACNQLPAGCSPAELYTPRVEADWISVDIQDDEDLKNTPFDCRQLPPTWPS
jgi:hypothetical protein